MYKIVSRNGIFETIDKKYANNHVVNTILFYLNDNCIVKAYKDNIPFCTIEISRNDKRITIYDKNENPKIMLGIPDKISTYFLTGLNDTIDIFQFLGGFNV